MLNNPKEFKKIMLTQKHNLETGFMYPANMPPTPPLRAESTPQMAPAMPPMPAAAPAAGAPPAAAPAPAMPRETAPLPSDPAAAATEAASEVGVQPAPSDASLDVTQTLARLADLRDSGAITTEEYEAKKQELLGRL